jgi:hypothetical protein
MTTYKSQFHAQCLSDTIVGEGLPNDREAQTLYQREIRYAARLARMAAKLVEDAQTGRYTGLLPVSWSEETGWTTIEILDCPRHWTPDQIAAFRELGEAVIAKMHTNPHAAFLIRGYFTTCPAWAIEYRDRAKRDRAIHALGINGRTGFHANGAFPNLTPQD